jgi:DNA-binding response OmpR family regulator
MLKILLIDDEQELCDALSFELKEAFNDGVEIEIVNAGFSGFDKIMETQYDLIITDNRMPELTGADLVQKARTISLSSNKVTPIIVLSAFVSEAQDSLKTRDNTFFISKPYDIESLTRKIKILTHTAS